MIAWCARRGAWRQGHRGRRVEDLTDLQVIEVGTAHGSRCCHLGVQSVNMAVHMNAEEIMLVETVRAFVDRDVKPTVREVEHANEYPEAWIEQMKRIGIYGLAVPEEYGGSPVSTPCYVLVTQELARGWMSLAGAMGGHTVVAKLLALFGTEEQKRQLPAADGDRRDAGHDGADRAGRRLGPAGHDDDRAAPTATSCVINGSKTWITNARRSGLIALLCKTDPAAKPAHKGISVLLVEHGDPGLTVSRDLPKLGYKGVESCELTFDDCRVPASAMLGGEPGKGFAQMMKGLETGRIQVASRALGVAHGRARGRAALRPGARELRQADLEAPGRSATTWPTWPPS